jgi:hypothetical protein
VNLEGVTDTGGSNTGTSFSSIGGKRTPLDHDYVYISDRMRGVTLPGTSIARTYPQIQARCEIGV